MSNKSANPDFPVWGESPLGGNGQEGTAPGFAPIRNTATICVPLDYDARAGVHISRLAQIELDDKAHALNLAKKTQADESFRLKAGFKRSL
jgi:hypothetical protein